MSDKIIAENQKIIKCQIVKKFFVPYFFYKPILIQVYFRHCERQNVMKKERVSFAPGALTAPIPPAMVTVGDMENANVLTVAWTGILATVPPKTYVSVRPSRYSYKILKERGEFVINLPSSSLAKTVDFVGFYTGAKVNKFEKCGLTKIESGKVSAPTIKECPVALECRVTDVIPMGSHDVFIADIVNVSCTPEIMDENGKMHFERADLLAYAHGEYYKLGEKLGRFGFSTDKAAKAPKKDSKEKKETQKKDSDTERRPFYENIPKGIKNKSKSQKRSRRESR